MFVDYEASSCPEFASLNTTVRSLQDAHQQTDPVEAANVQVQTTHKEQRRVQTEVSMDVSMASKSYDDVSLASFLRRVTPNVFTQLDRNISSHAFDCYDPRSLDDDNDNGKLSLLHTLKCDKFNGGYSSAESKMSCSALTWNSTGSVFAVSYGVTVHEGWCVHSSGFAVWNLNRRDFSGTKPNTCVEASACLTSLRFHPMKPALIAGGNHNGDVFVWNLNREDDVLVVSSNPLDEFGHGESVTSLYWIEDNRGYRVIMFPSGSDGRIIAWKLTDRNSRLEPIKRFVVLAENLPKTFGSKSRRATGEVGVTDLSFCNDDPTIFFAALEGGGLVQCSFDSHQPTKDVLTGSGLQLLSPIVLSLLPHPGHLTAIECSPFERNLMATCGLDGELRFYSLLQPGSPVFTVNHDDPLESLCWSPVCPLLVATVTSRGAIIFFSVEHDHVEQRFASDQHPDSGFSKLLFNPKELMATTSKATTEAYVYQLGGEFLVSSSLHDARILNEFCTSVQ